MTETDFDLNVLALYNESQKKRGALPVHDFLDLPMSLQILGSRFKASYEFLGGSSCFTSRQVAALVFTFWASDRLSDMLLP